MENQQKWHQKPVTAVLFLIFFFPVGLYLMWKNNLWSKTTRVIVSVFFGLLVVGNLMNDKNFDKPKIGEYSTYGDKSNYAICGNHYIKLKENNDVEFYGRTNNSQLQSCVAEGKYFLDKDYNLVIVNLHNSNALGLESQFNGNYIWKKDGDGFYSFFKKGSNIKLSNYSIESKKIKIDSDFNAKSNDILNNTKKVTASSKGENNKFKEGDVSVEKAYFYSEPKFNSIQKSYIIGGEEVKIYEDLGSFYFIGYVMKNGEEKKGYVLSNEIHVFY